jgi:hypothetical protein
VSSWGEIFLGVIAIATLSTAIVQVGVLVAAGRLARRAERLMDHVEHELAPLFVHLNSIGQEMSRAASLTSGQFDRVDRLLADTGHRIEQGIGALQASLSAPAKESVALLRGLQAAFNSLRTGRSGRAGAEGDDALFI